MARESKSMSQWGVGWRRLRRNPAGIFGLAIIVIVASVGTFAPLIAPHDPFSDEALLEGKATEGPSWEYPFGTDGQGMDVFSRVLYGARTALAVGLGAISIAALIGITLGAIAGYFGGELDSIVMRITDAVMVLPIFLIILLLSKMMDLMMTHAASHIRGVNEIIVIVIIGIFGWTGIARITRAEFLRLEQSDFVKAARSYGASDMKIAFRHILPNALPPIVVMVTLGIGTAIMYEASMSFLGFGDPQVVSWGMMLSLAQRDLPVAWWEAVFPGLAIFLIVLGVNMLGDALNEAFNPRLRG